MYNALLQNVYVFINRRNKTQSYAVGQFELQIDVDNKSLMRVLVVI